jgi:ppGpp synthetase/RelA/SpoT-type nucleotidyltranferase
MPTDVIEHFIARYRKEYDFFDQASRLAAQILGGRLRAAGIRSMVTSRAKAVDRLEAKVRERAPRKNYASAEEIFADVVDLAGVRVAMYFPGDHAQVDTIVRSLFTLVDDPRKFPDPATPPKYKKRFSGYLATHYRVQLKETALSEAEKRYAEAKLEIQVASVLMHSWAEVEHDLVYKPQQGELSQEEYTILDEINGLVLAGELALERLQKAGETRVAAGGRRFSNHYDLAAHLLGAASTLKDMPIADTALGRVDLLYELLRRLKLGTPEQLKRYIASVSADFEERPLSEQIINQLLAEDKRRYALYNSIRAARPVAGDTFGHTREDVDQEQHKALDLFLHQWVGLEQKVNEQMKNLGKERIYPSSRLLSDLGLSDDALLKEFERIRRMRNEVVHGLAMPAAADLREAGAKIQEITETLSRLEANRADKANAK